MADRRALLGTDLRLDYVLRGLFEDADLATAVDTASS